MTSKTLLLAGALMLWASATLCAQTDTGHAFPVTGKAYTIHRFGESNGYMYENGNLLCAAASSNTQKQYWQFEPTSNDSCYYIKNVTSGRYIQSTANTYEIQIKTAATPVEFKVVKNSHSGASPAGYYYICSTDQTIDDSMDGTLGLNYQASSGKVVGYYIRYNRPNSYWDIVESTYDYEAPAPVERSAYAKRLGIYNQPCGSLSTAYLTSCTLTGDSVYNELNYTASAMPTNYWTPVRTDTAELVRGTKIELAYVAAGVDENNTVTAYFDWDGDGVFEARQDFFSTVSGSAEVEVPKEAKLGKVRMRMRLTDNGLEDAEDDVNGTIYDFTIIVTQKTPSPATAIAEVEKPACFVKTKAYGVDGRRVNKDTHRGVFIESGKKLIKK